jgi:adenylate kinase
MGFRERPPRPVSSTAFWRAASFTAPIVFDLAIAPEILIARLSSRRQGPACDRTFQLVAGAPNRCPHDAADSIIRNDDQPATVRRRLQIYAENISEIVRFYQNRGYHRVDASQPVEKITQKLLTRLGLAAGNSGDSTRPVLTSQQIYA